MAEHPTFGWWFPPGSRKAHYCPPAVDGEMRRAYCRKWGFLFDPAPGIFETDTGPTPDDCKQCRRKLEVVR